MSSRDYQDQKNQYKLGMDRLNKLIEKKKIYLQSQIFFLNKCIGLIFILEACFIGVLLYLSTKVMRRYSRKIENMYQVEKENYDSLYNAFLNSVILAKTDASGNINFANNKFCEISGYEFSELTGKNHRILKSGLHSQEFYEDLWSTIISNKVWHGEICNKRKNGEYYWVDCTIIPELDYDGRLKGYVSVRYDITERKETERNLLINSKLATLGETTASVAHEINNPLTILKAKLKIVERKISTNELTIDSFLLEIEVLQRLVLRIEKIISGLTKYSRAGTDDAYEVINLNVLIDETIDLCESKLTSNNVEIVKKLDSQIMLECHQTQISQIILILINNSIDAIMNDDVKWIRIDSKLVNGIVIISISDSGKRIPDNIAKKLMTPLFTTKGVGKGSGLGLNIAKKLAGIHHGKFYLDRNEERNTFVLELPLKQI